MQSYDPAGWQSFFVAIISAGAALTGLLFVAVSINLDRILKAATFLTTRAAETLSSLLLIVVTAALVLVPQNLRLVGLEIVVLVVPMLVITVRNQLAYRRRNPGDPRLWLVSRMTCTAAATVPASLAGLSLAAHWGGGLYWLAVTALLGIIGAVYSAWVLLIEIVR